MRFLPSAPATRLMPTSITVAPGLIQSPRTISGRPTAANRMSARRQTAGRSRVFECATVTVAFSASRSCDQRLADDVGAADHHGLHAFERAVHGLRQHDAAERRAGRRAPAARSRAARHSSDGSRRRPCRDRPRCSTLLAVDLLRQRKLHQDAVHRRIGVELLRPAPADRSRTRFPAGGDRTIACRLRPSASTCCAHRRRSPDFRRPARPRGPARALRCGDAPRSGCDRLAVDDPCACAPVFRPSDRRCRSMIRAVMVRSRLASLGPG